MQKRPDSNTRKAQIRAANDGAFEIVLATETPVTFRGYDEILLADGMQESRMVDGALPLLDSHNRDSISDQLGSVTNIGAVGSEIVGNASISDTKPDIKRMIEERHIRGVSVGYRVDMVATIPKGETQTINGREFTAAPTRELDVVTSWTPHEISLTPVPADVNSLVREMDAGAEADETETAHEDRDMAEKSKATAPATPEAGENIDTAAIAARAAEQARTEERQRVADITEAASRFAETEGVDELQRTAIAGDTTVEAFRGQLLQHLAERHKSSAPATVTRDEADHRRDNMQAAILCRTAKWAPTDEDRKRAEIYVGRTQLDLARECVEAAGISTRGMSKEQIIGRAFTSTGDYPYILENAIGKQLLAAYAAAEHSWSTYCKRGSVSDFKTVRRIKIGESGTMSVVPEGAEFPQYAVSEERESLTAYTYGKIFAITRQAMINDDLSAFDEIPAFHGRAWARTINQLAIKVLLTNAALTDAVALFHATHKNLDTSTTAVTTSATAAAVVRALKKLLRLQTGIDGSYLNLRPSVVLTGPTLEDYYAQALGETNRADNNAASDLRSLGLTLAVEPEIENSALTGYGTNITYMFVSPMDAPTVEVAFLDGNDAPRLEQEAAFTVDGVKLKVAGDVGTAAIDYRGAAKHVL